QAEDGIRDFHVTGVQTCALPIWLLEEGPRAVPLHRIASEAVALEDPAHGDGGNAQGAQPLEDLCAPEVRKEQVHHGQVEPLFGEIGRASCRERVQMRRVDERGWR